MSRKISTKHVKNKDITSIFRSDSDIFPVKMLTKLYLMFGSKVIAVVDVCKVETATDVIICVVDTRTVVDCAYDDDDD